MKNQIIPSKSKYMTPRKELARHAHRLLETMSIKELAEAACKSEDYIKRLIREFPK